MGSAATEGGPSGLDTGAVSQRTRASLRVLGPISGTAPEAQGSRRIDLGGPRQRRLLAALAVDAGRPLPGDRLADRVWGDHLPEDPRASLRTLVARLRSALGAEVIVTDAAGYRLDAAADQASGAITLDSLTFLELVARADAPTVGLLGRLELLEAALALWGGPAYDEVAHEEWARAEAERLEELRATTSEDRFEAMLAAGKHRDALPQLAGAVESFPLRDRLVGLQMLALFRAGRQARRRGSSRPIAPISPPTSASSRVASWRSSTAGSSSATPRCTCRRTRPSPGGRCAAIASANSWARARSPSCSAAPSHRLAGTSP